MLRRAIHDATLEFLQTFPGRFKPGLRKKEPRWLEEEPLGPMVLAVVSSQSLALLEDTAYTYARTTLRSAAEEANLVRLAPTRFFRVKTRGAKVAFHEIPLEETQALAARPSLSRAPYRRRALAIHRLLVAEAAKHPEMLTAYADDLHRHDLAMLEEAHPGDTFAWVLRPCGTHFIHIRPDHEREDGGFLRTVLATFGTPRCCYLLKVQEDGGTLREMGAQELLKRLHAA